MYSLGVASGLLSQMACRISSSGPFTLSTIFILFSLSGRSHSSIMSRACSIQLSKLFFSRRCRDDTRECSQPPVVAVTCRLRRSMHYVSHCSDDCFRCGCLEGKSSIVYWVQLLCSIPQLFINKSIFIFRWSKNPPWCITPFW